MIEWTDETLRKAASWKSFKEGRALFESGAVIEAKRGSASYQGSVASGRRPLRVSVQIRSATDVEARCPCPENQSSGALCAHAVAVGLAVLSGKPAVTAVTAAEPHAASTPPRRWEIVFARNWRDSLGRGKLTASLAEPTESGDLTAADERLGDWFARERVSPKTGLTFNLSGPQTRAFLVAIADHSGLFSGSERTPITLRTGARLSLSETTLENEEVRLVPAGGNRWVEIDSAFFSQSGDEILHLGVTGPGQPSAAILSKLASGQAVRLGVSELFQNLDRWQEWLEFPPDGWLDRLHFIPAKPAFELQLDGSLQHLVATLAVRYGDSDPVPPGLGLVRGLPKVSSDGCLVRDLAAEEKAVRHLATRGFEAVDPGLGCWALKGESGIIEFLAAGLAPLRDQWQVRESDGFRKVKNQLVLVEPRIEIEGAGEDWLSFNLKFQASDGFVVSPEEVRRMLRSGRASGKVSGGKHLVVSSEVSEIIEPLLADLDLRQENGRFIADSESGTVIQEFLKNHQKQHKANKEEVEDGIQFPPSIKAELRPYQRQGAAWLLNRVSRWGGALLGDDMGLGKTLQTIVLIESLFQSPSAVDKQVLVIATASLLGNWAAEFAKFAPARKVKILHGSGRDELRDGFVGGEVMVTSFGTLVRDLAWHLQREYVAVVVDEASLMRNPDTDHAKAVAKLNALHRVALTGTPIENGVRDLWSIFRFVKPGWLGSRENFKERYEVPLSSGSNPRPVMECLRLKISPFFLRRTKEQVAPELPTKLIIDEFCELTSEQQAVYKQLLEEGRRRVDEMLDSKNSGAARMRMLAALLRLRQTCCDLALLGNERFNQWIPAKRSAKMQRLLELAEEAIFGDHKILIFSQFQKQLLEIENCFSERGWSCLRLDGQTRNRQKLVDQFQSEGGPPLFLISLKAGGYGLNLTAADTVIHFDPWWNPAAEAQATDRAHRIGQARPVTVYRLLTRGTVEEKVVRLQAKKRDLASGIDETGEGEPTGWGVEDFKSVFE
jgi:superfamily II DNA or RNA helicase